MKTQWLKICEDLQNRLNPGTYKVWVAPLTADLEGEGKIRLSAPNGFVATWVRDRLLNDISDATDWDDDDQNNDIFTVGRKVKIDLADMDHVSWLHDLEKDAENLELLSLMVQDITPAYDAKLQELLRLIDEKQRHPINPGNRKIIIFTAFSDTADYLYQNISGYVKQAFGLNTAEITGSVDGKTTIPKLSGDLNSSHLLFAHFQAAGQPAERESGGY